jgi:hypothetical protein
MVSPTGGNPVNSDVGQQALLINNHTQGKNGRTPSSYP